MLYRNLYLATNLALQKCTPNSESISENIAFFDFESVFCFCVYMRKENVFS